MKKLGLFIAVFVAVVVIGGRWYYTSQIEEQLDQASSALAQLGGRLEYRDVYISIGGTVAIEGLRVFAPGTDALLKIERLALETGSPLGVYQLANAANSQVLPQTLTLAFEGMTAPVIDGNTAAMHPFGLPGMERMIAAGCESRETFTPVDYLDMGYADPVYDVRMSYDVQAGGELVVFNSTSTAPELHASDINLEFYLGAKSLTFQDIAVAAMGTRLLSANAKYQDFGFFNRVNEFCLQQEGVDTKVYFEKIVSNWSQAWMWLNVKPGEHLTRAYSDFIENPDSFEVTFKPIQKLSVNELISTSFSQFPFRFNTEIVVNEREYGEFDLTPLTETELVAWQQSFVDEKQLQEQAAITPQESFTSQPIPKSEWASYQGVDVVIETVEGAVMAGVIDSLEEKNIQFQVFSYGGFIIKPIEYASIKSLYLPN